MLRYAGMRPGELSVTRAGRCLKPRLCAGSWGTQDKVSCRDRHAGKIKHASPNMQLYVAPLSSLGAKERSHLKLD